MCIYICLVFIYVFICVCVYIYIYIYILHIYINIPMLLAHSWVAGIQWSLHRSHLYSDAIYTASSSAKEQTVYVYVCYRCNKTLHGSGFYIYIYI